jgi:hypothetical protein
VFFTDFDRNFYGVAFLTYLAIAATGFLAGFSAFCVEFSLLGSSFFLAALCERTGDGTVTVLDLLFPANLDEDRDFIRYRIFQIFINAINWK